MDQLFIINHSKTDKYGDEYFDVHFVSAPSTENAWLLAGANLGIGSVTCLGANCFDDGLETFSLDIWTPEDCEFWEVFDSARPDEWVEDFMVWAVESRDVAARLHDMANAQNPPCNALLNLDQFISLAEQYKIEESILHKKASTPSVKRKSL